MMGDFFMKLIPWYYRWLAIIIALAAAAAFGAAKMHGYMQDKVDKLEAQADRDKAINAALFAKQALDFKVNAGATQKGFKDEKDAIHEYYRTHPVVVRVFAGQRPEPAASCIGGDDAGPAEPVAAGRNTGFQQACALDAAQVNAWRDWCVRNNCKVE